MKLSEFDFPFDPTLIAMRPQEPRDQARLLVLRRTSGDVAHHRVADLSDLLRPGDVLVLNDTKVVPARLRARKIPTGGRVDLLLIKELSAGVWETFVQGTVRAGQVLELPGGDTVTVERQGRGGSAVRFTSGLPVPDLLQKIGDMPLPPYIKRPPCDQDREWYQTVFARRPGAIAAPTAGLHLTHGLLDSLEKLGVRRATVTLHVGPGTFLPVRTERIQEHRLRSEWVEVSAETAMMVNRSRQEGGRVIAVGTTVVRALEAAAHANGTVTSWKGETDLFVLPGYRFRVIDGLMTNFHLPRTTLLMLVAAFSGIERLRAAYRTAVRERYRFYSYGDAMLIL